MQVYPDKVFLRETPAAAGIDSAAIAAMLKDIRDTGKDIHSMLLLRGGRLVFEQYFAPYDADTRHAMYSCSKTFTSMLIGIAQAKGLLSIGDAVLDYFPDVPVADVSDNLRAMTLRDLLMMGTGHARDTFEPMMRARAQDMASVFLNTEVAHAPGTHFVYNTGATYMLSAILTRITGRTALALAKDWIFDKIGIEGARWNARPRGVSLGGTGLRIRPLDMARFGLLLLRGGAWQGEQIIPRAYVEEAASKQIDNRNPDDPHQNPNWAAGYCYQMWRCGFDDCFRADGMGGQFIVMLPRHDMVAVFTSALGGDIGYPLDLIEKHLLPSLHSTPLPTGQEEARALAELSAALRAPRSLAEPDWLGPDRLPARAFQLAENPLGLRRIAVEGDALALGFARGEMRLSFGWGAPVTGAARGYVPGGHFARAQFAASARWDGALHVRIGVVGEPFTQVITIARVGADLRASVRVTIGKSFEVSAHAQ